MKIETLIMRMTDTLIMEPRSVTLAFPPFPFQGDAGGAGDELLSSCHRQDVESNPDVQFLAVFTT
jgi:hypothetical protein